VRLRGRYHSKQGYYGDEAVYHYEHLGTVLRASGLGHDRHP
jgi:hypothetical protein